MVWSLDMPNLIHFLAHCIHETLQDHQSSLKPFCSVSLTDNVPVMVITIYSYVNVTSAEMESLHGIF
jgi:hypothetical protein